MYRLEGLSHTADVGYEVTADSLAELFRGAAAGLIRTVLADPEPPLDGPADDRAPGSLPGPGPEDGAEVETLSLERPDRERLMVAWLRELLYRMTGEGRFSAGVKLEMTGPASLRAELRWSDVDRAGGPTREVKGITYHGLRVDRDEDGRWHARLVLDV